MVCLSSSVPPVLVYLVKFFPMASIAACFTFSGVGKSGSPAPKSTTSAPSLRRRSASAATFMVEETLMSEILSASVWVVGMIGPAPSMLFRDAAPQVLFDQRGNQSRDIA